MKNKIQDGFSRAAVNYDRHTELHRRIADELLASLTELSVPSTVLDVGCGTGYLAVRIKESFPESHVAGVDFARGMIDVAAAKRKDIDWIIADGDDLPFAAGSFNLVVSNLAYQWVGHLIRVFNEARRVLVDDGDLACTIFGYNTCRELFYSLEKATQGALKFSRLPDEAQVREALDLSGYKSFKVDSRELKVEFKEMQELTGWLRTIGANNLAREGFLGPQALAEASRIYGLEYPYLNGVAATFEVIRVYAKK